MTRNQQKLTEILSKLKSTLPNESSSLISFFKKDQKVASAVSSNNVWDKEFVEEFKKVYPGVYVSYSPTDSCTTTTEGSSGTRCTSSSAPTSSVSIIGSGETETSSNCCGNDYTEDPLFLSLKDKMVRCVPEFSDEEQSLLVRLPTSDFEGLVKLSCKTSSPEFCEKLVYVVCTKYDSGRRQKLVLLLRHLVVTMIISGAPVREFLNTFKLVTSADSTIPPEHIYLPMIQQKVVIPRPAWKDIDKESLLRHCVTWMSSENLELTQYTISVYKLLMDDQTKLDEDVLHGLIDVLKRSLQSAPDSLGVSGLLALFVSNNAWQLKKPVLQELSALNGLNNCNNNKTAIDKCISEKLSLL